VQSDSKIKTALEIVKIQICKYCTVKQNQLIQINDNTVNSLKFRDNSYDILLLIIVLYLLQIPTDPCTGKRTGHKARGYRKCHNYSM
jgi:hypothetical protein